MIATCIVHFLVQQSAAAQGEENLSFNTTYTCTHGFDNAIYSSPVALTVVDDIKKGAISKNKLKSVHVTTIPACYSSMHPTLLHACAWLKFSFRTSAAFLSGLPGFWA